MSIVADDPLTPLSFSVYENKGVFALLIGSGISRAAEIPTGWEITLDLVRRVGEAKGAEPQADWAQWYRETAGEEPNYSKLLEELASSPNERRSILHSYIEPTDEDREEGRKVPTAAHRAIAQLVRAGYVRVIITTNFDRLMENALREVGVEPTVVASVEALRGAEPITHTNCYILKLHGDYKDARILNTDEELSGYPNEYDVLLDRIIDEFGLIVCGWSGEWDHALRAALLRAPNRRYPLFWAARGKVASGAQELIDHRHAKVIEIGEADRFFEGIGQRVETLERTYRQNPLSIDLLVNSAKRYLTRPEHRIQLDQLITDECEKVITGLGTDRFPLHAQFSPEEFGDRIARYEAATEGLAKVAGVLGRWGDDKEFPLIVDLLEALHAHAATEGSGLNVWLDIRSYPAVLLFTAYGLGLTRAERWSNLHKLLNTKLIRPYRDPLPLVRELFLWAWKGGNNDYWKKMAGLETRKTALSDHLLYVFQNWSSSFVGVISELDVLFERFEILASITYLDGTPTEDLVRANESASPTGWGWMPVGRSGWHSEVRERVLKQINASPLSEALLDAGFANGKADHMAASQACFLRIANRMEWQ